MSVTVVPEVKSALQLRDSQSIPAGDEVTRPFPWTTTVSRCWPCGGGVAAANVALTSRSASSVRSQPPLPLQAPAQPKKTAPESGTAIRWTCEPETYCALQLPRQSAPAPRTSPLPEVVRRRVAWDGLRSPEPPLLEPQAVTATATKKMPIGPRIASPTHLEEGLTCGQQATSLKQVPWRATSRHVATIGRPEQCSVGEVGILYVPALAIGELDETEPEPPGVRAGADRRVLVEPGRRAIDGRVRAVIHVRPATGDGGNHGGGARLCVGVRGSPGAGRVRRRSGGASKRGGERQSAKRFHCLTSGRDESYPFTAGRLRYFGSPPRSDPPLAGRSSRAISTASRSTRRIRSALRRIPCRRGGPGDCPPPGAALRGGRRSPSPG